MSHEDEQPDIGHKESQYTKVSVSIELADYDACTEERCKQRAERV